MVQKPERGRYVTLEDVRVSYKPKDNTIHLTSSDPDIPNGSFYLTLNTGTATEEALREMLREQGLIREPEPSEVTVDTKEYKRADKELKDVLAALLLEGKMNSSLPRIFMQGRPGSGKTVASMQAVCAAKSLDIPTIIVSDRGDMSIFSGEDWFTHKTVAELGKGFLNPFQLGLADSDAIGDVLYSILSERFLHRITGSQGSHLRQEAKVQLRLIASKLKEDTRKPTAREAFERLIKDKELPPEIRDGARTLLQEKYSLFNKLVLEWNESSEDGIPTKGTVLYDLGELSRVNSYGQRRTKWEIAGDLISGLLAKKIGQALEARDKKNPVMLVLDDLAPDEHTEEAYADILLQARSLNLGAIVASQGERYSNWTSPNSPLVTDYFKFSDHLHPYRKTLKMGESEWSTSADPEESTLVANGISLYLSNLWVKKYGSK